MQWLLTQQLSGEAQAAVRDWVHGCYLPAKTRLLQRAESLGLSLTFQDFLPWGGSALQQELPLLEVTPGQQTGLVALLQRFLGLGGPLPAIRCDAYFVTTAERVLEWLETTDDATGDAAGPGLCAGARVSPVKTRCAFCSTGEMLRAAGPEVPAPSLTGLVPGTPRHRPALGRCCTTRHRGPRASALGAPEGPGLATAGGAITTLAQGGGNELQRILDGMSGFVGLAVFLTWWGPYILGLVNLVVLGLFPHCGPLGLVSPGPVPPSRDLLCRPAVHDGLTAVVGARG